MKIPIEEERPGKVVDDKDDDEDGVVKVDDDEKEKEENSRDREMIEKTVWYWRLMNNNKPIWTRRF